jgi:four helix bundle protein
MKSKNIIIDKSFDFAVEIVRMVKVLQETHTEYVLSTQLRRSATSIGANVREAHNAESKRDFIHKMGIAQKECAETKYWLELLVRINFLLKDDFSYLHNNATELIKILKSIIISTKQNSNIS